MRINKKLFEIKDVKFRKKFSSKIPLLLEKDSRVRIIKIGRVERFESLEPEKDEWEEERVQHFPRNDVAWQRIFLSILHRLGKQKIRQLYAADDQFAIDSRANPAVIISNPFPLLERSYTFEQGILYIGVAAELWKLARSAARQPR